MEVKIQTSRGPQSVRVEINKHPDNRKSTFTQWKMAFLGDAGCENCEIVIGGETDNPDTLAGVLNFGPMALVSSYYAITDAIVWHDPVEAPRAKTYEKGDVVAVLYQAPGRDGEWLIGSYGKLRDDGKHEVRAMLHKGLGHLEEFGHISHAHPIDVVVDDDRLRWLGEEQLPF